MQADHPLAVKAGDLAEGVVDPQNLEIGVGDDDPSWVSNATVDRRSWASLCSRSSSATMRMEKVVSTDPRLGIAL